MLTEAPELQGESAALTVVAQPMIRAALARVPYDFAGAITDSGWYAKAWL